MAELQPVIDARLKTTVWVDGFRVVESEHHLGPSYLLSESDPVIAGSDSEGMVAAELAGSSLRVLWDPNSLGCGERLELR